MLVAVNVALSVGGPIGGELVIGAGSDARSMNTVRVEVEVRPAPSVTT